MPTLDPAAPGPAPDHACAVISAGDGRWLLQLRPAEARHAASQLTCFGGRREPRESAELCLRRELIEELGWAPPSCRPVCDLRVAGRWIARFFACAMPAGVRLTTEPGHVAVWVPPAALPGLPVSPWHRAVLQAVAGGTAAVDLPA